MVRSANGDHGSGIRSTTDESCVCIWILYLVFILRGGITGLIHRYQSSALLECSRSLLVDVEEGTWHIGPVTRDSCTSLDKTFDRSSESIYKMFDVVSKLCHRYHDFTVSYIAVLSLGKDCPDHVWNPDRLVRSYLTHRL